MKKKTLLLPLLALACACTGNQTGSQTDTDSLGVDSAQGIVLDSLTCHLHRNLIEGQDAPCYDITFSLLAAQGDDEASRQFNEELARALFGKTGIGLDSAMHFVADSVAASYTADLKEFYDQNSEYDFSFMYSREQKADVDSTSYPGVAAYSTDLYEYTGGAHGNLAMCCLNLNLHTGRAIRRDDFFVTEKLPEVKALVEQSLCTQFGCQNMGQLMEKTAIGSLGEVYVRDDNFLLLADSVEFVYNPYEIAPWACGLLRARVAYSDLKPCIHAEALPQDKQ